MQHSRKLQMQLEGPARAEASRQANTSGESDWVPAQGVAEEGLNGFGGNSLAREAFLQRFDGSDIDTVFAPGEYHIPE